MAEENGFVLPEFMQNQGVDQIHNEMLAVMPSDLDKSEGGMLWDFSRPTAFIVAEGIGFVLAEAMKQLTPMHAYGEGLDRAATQRGMSRKKATFATVPVTFMGVVGAKIPIGFKVATESLRDSLGLEFQTIASGTIGEGGTIVLEAAALMAGKAGNIVAKAIVMQSSPLKGIVSVSNDHPGTGGIEAESDDMLRERMVDYDRSQGVSFVGSDADYKRWALSCPGVGAAVVIAAQDDTGLVNIVLTDGSGDPASEQICETVYDFIMSPNQREKRLAPVNAFLKCTPPQTVTIRISATVEIEGSNLEVVKAAYLALLKDYYKVAAQTGEIKYSMVGAILSKVAGVNDYNLLRLNGGTKNVPIKKSELAMSTQSDLTLILGEVGGELG